MVIVFLNAFLEACVGIGLFITGLILLSVCTFLYVEQIATLQQMLPLVFCGALLGDHSGYYIGRWLGPRFHHTRFAIKQAEKIAKLEKWMKKYGSFAIIIGRFFTAIRSVVPLMSGVSGLPRLRYTLYDLLACGVWTIFLGLMAVGVDKIWG